MSACNKCGCSPCGCGPSVLNNPQIIGGVFDGPTINGPTINGGQANNLNLVGAQIDCTSRACTAGVGICNDGVATNAQVCNSIAAAISGSNPAFCDAVADCLSANPTDLCPAVASCIATSPGIINTTAAFGFNSRATTALFGVVRYATIGEVNAGNCLLALDPCTLISALTAPNVSSPFWLAITSAVCAAGASCFAPLDSPAFTGIPTAPTAAAGTNTTQIATTAFVTTAINNAISSTNPAFCGAVAACLSGGAPTCASVSALFPAAGGNPPAGTRFLGSDCLSYTAAQILATGGGGGGGTSGGGCGFQLSTFTGPYAVQNQNGGGLGAGWIGADNSAGAGFAIALFFMDHNCSNLNESNGAAMWTNVSNGVAATIRSGACHVVTFPNCNTGGSGVQS
jgi:hypothetical protein